MGSIRLSALGDTQVATGKVTVTEVRVVVAAPGTLVLSDGFDGTAKPQALIECYTGGALAYNLPFPNGLFARLQGGDPPTVEIDYQ